MNKIGRPRKENKITATAEYQREWRENNPWYYAKKMKKYREIRSKKSIYQIIKEKRCVI